ncbi:hypothetical protein E4634_13615 [Mangrovimicrobium sediminis]|uniref:Uncharacterized protein n=1 Tax=Mangrovimicrobium sediminis TaxID=2562682 RepID=A0A4Z0LZL5_9GAMM|nr:hypothetical protein [Haliea sp. SAOS-164]TGD72558.1 hypothetical protein E4634_13615 [Haliea sp. SAOS-164]
MLGYMRNHLEYSNAVLDTLQSLVDEGAFSAVRAGDLRLRLADRAQVENTVVRMEYGSADSAFRELASNCWLHFEGARARGDNSKGDYLKLATRALMLGGLPESDAGEELSALARLHGQRAQTSAGDTGVAIH